VPALGALGAGATQDVVPRGSPLPGGDCDRARQLEEVGRLGDHSSRALDPEDHLVAGV
jgi:hypothetical protein